MLTTVALFVPALAMTAYLIVRAVMRRRQYARLMAKLKRARRDREFMDGDWTLETERRTRSRENVAGT